MLVITGGRERTTAEYARLLDAAGLALRSVVPVALRMVLFEGGQAGT